MPAAPDDWRRRGQEDTLKGVQLERRPYTPPRPGWDHDHCAFCWAKFMAAEAKPADPKILTEGYVTEDDQWICDECFADFREEFGWKVREAGSG